MDGWMDGLNDLKGASSDLHKPDIQHWQEIVAIKIVPK